MLGIPTEGIVAIGVCTVVTFFVGFSEGLRWARCHAKTTCPFLGTYIYRYHLGGIPDSPIEASERAKGAEEDGKD